MQAGGNGAIGRNYLKQYEGNGHYLYHSDKGTLAAQALHAVGVTVVSVRRASGAVIKPEDALVLSAGDTLVLSGLPEPLALAEGRLLGR